ncbi:MAG TPA: hypothetical protein VM121_00780 [Acidimicrobiales bacterium]|nr:hypothetical protein [Acidimicrobiales bacterium]
MDAMAAGDRAAVFVLYREFGGMIGAALRREIRAMGIEFVRPEELGDLVIDACFELNDCAGAWRPDGGALPWTWAARRLRQVVIRHIGVLADELDHERLLHVSEAPPVSGAQEPEEVAVLAGLAALDDSCALLQKALAKVASARDRALLLELKVQASLGDPSPALTVANRNGMRPDAVRQAAKRTLDRLRRLAHTDEHFAGLSCLAILR